MELQEGVPRPQVSNADGEPSTLPNMITSPAISGFDTWGSATFADHAGLHVAAPHPAVG